MTQHEDTPASEPQPRAAAHNLSWIAMVAMAVMCAATLVWAASLSTG
ncbi:MAG: hypothetical protein NVV74_07025 [Magnetospirillum sp.]|nr:hypothetical protein [Magnetospirillum sp.]